MFVKRKICHAKVCSEGLQIGRCTERKAGELSSVLNCEVAVTVWIKFTCAEVINVHLYNLHYCIMDLLVSAIYWFVVWHDVSPTELGKHTDRILIKWVVLRNTSHFGELTVHDGSYLPYQYHRQSCGDMYIIIEYN